uniref:Uncharacterized protein n=1 Tax=Ditylenchus dipsaci TaxID=166011 RepID=A0A915DVJ7_9BILA
MLHKLFSSMIKFGLCCDWTCSFSCLLEEYLLWVTGHGFGKFVQNQTYISRTVPLLTTTLFATSHGFFDIGTNAGSDGEYASRAFNQKLGPTKSFHRRGAASSHSHLNYLFQIHPKRWEWRWLMILRQCLLATIEGCFLSTTTTNARSTMEACIIGVAVCKPVSFAKR